MASNPMLRGQCDVCGVQFDVALQEEEQAGGGIKIVFDCPNGHRYEVAYLPARAVKIRAEVNRLKAERNPANTRRIRRLQEQYERLYVGLSRRQAPENPEQGGDVNGHD